MPNNETTDSFNWQLKTIEIMRDAAEDCAELHQTFDEDDDDPLSYCIAQVCHSGHLLQDVLNHLSHLDDLKNLDEKQRWTLNLLKTYLYSSSKLHSQTYDRVAQMFNEKDCV